MCDKCFIDCMDLRQCWTWRAQHSRLTW